MFNISTSSSCNRGREVKPLSQLKLYIIFNWNLLYSFLNLFPVLQLLLGKNFTDKGKVCGQFLLLRNIKSSPQYARCPLSVVSAVSCRWSNHSTSQQFNSTDQLRDSLCRVYSRNLSLGACGNLAKNIVHLNEKRSRYKTN